jgi:uncharacterized membrane protein
MIRAPTKAEIVLSYVLRGGLLLAIILGLYGGALLLWSQGTVQQDFSTFKQEPLFLESPFTLFHEIAQNNPLALIQLGLLILIITPFMRVLSCLIIFIFEKDGLYIIISTIVLSILSYSLFFKDV